jgi:TP901 family phage tail tape measure protein
LSFSVFYTYKIKDLYSGPLGKIRKTTDRFNKAIGKTRVGLKKFSNSALSAQNTLGTVAGVIGGAAVLGQFTNFEESMNKLNAVTLATENQMKSMRGVAKELGATTQFTASQAAQGMTFLGMAGLDTNKILEAIPGTLELAAAGGLDLATAADIATNVLAQMGLQTKDLVKVNDNLALMQARSNTNIIQGAEALKNLGTTSSSLGFTLSQTTAMIGAMANAGVKSGEAGTLLRNAMLRLVNPSGKARKVMKQLKIDMREFITPDGKIKNFTGLIELLNKKGATTQQMFNIFEERGGRAILALQKIGKPAIDELTKALENSAGTAEKMSKIMMTGLPGVIKAFKSAMEAVNLAIFETGLGDFLIDVFKGVTKFLRGLGKVNPVILKTIGFLGLIAVVGAPTIMVLGLIASGVSAILAIGPALATVGGVIAGLSLPVVAVSAVIATLSVGIFNLIKNNSILRNALMKLFQAFKPIVSISKAMFNVIGLLFSKLFEGKTIVIDTEEVILRMAFAIESLANVIEILLSPLQLMADIMETIEDFDISTTVDMLKSVSGDMLSQGLSKATNFLGLGDDAGGNVSSEFSKATKGSLNGRIGIDVTGPGTVKRAEMQTSFPGNLGFNMGS